MKVFESQFGLDFVKMMNQNIPSIEKSLANIVKELSRANDAAEGKITVTDKAIMPFDYLVEFAAGIKLNDMVGCRQLRSLWTSYCIVNDVNPDTSEYDTALYLLWETIQPVWKGTSFDEFDEFMCENLC